MEIDHGGGGGFLGIPDRQRKAFQFERAWRFPGGHALAGSIQSRIGNNLLQRGASLAGFRTIALARQRSRASAGNQSALVRAGIFLVEDVISQGKPYRMSRHAIYRLYDVRMAAYHHVRAVLDQPSRFVPLHLIYPRSQFLPPMDIDDDPIRTEPGQFERLGDTGRRDGVLPFCGIGNPVDKNQAVTNAVAGNEIGRFGQTRASQASRRQCATRIRQPAWALIQGMVIGKAEKGETRIG